MIPTQNRVALVAALLSIGAAQLAPVTTAGAQERTTLPILDPVTLTASCEYILQDARKRADELASLPLEEATVQTVLDEWDLAAIARENVIGPVAILNNVHPDRRVREAAEGCIRQLTSFNTELYQNEALFQRIEAVRTDDPIAARLRTDLLEYFEDTGVNLPPGERARAREITERLTALRQEFDRNLRDDETRLTFSPEEYDGVPQSYIDRAERDEHGNITVGMDFADYAPFMRSAVNPDARYRYYMAYQNVGAPRNLEVLNEIATLRRELSGLHQQPSYAHHIIRRRMAESPEAVEEFLASVRATVTAAEEAELEELRRLKAEVTGEPLERTALERWDIAFYRERLRESRYAIDQEELRRYFPTEITLDWTLDMSADLFGVAFEEATVPVWHPEVRYFDVTDAATGDFLGGLYVDLYPRSGKYGHAAVWSVRRSSELAERRPISVLVTNFDRQGLTHSELETLLHELGHALHNIFSETRYNLHGGTSVAWDFVEAPSQMLEEWGRRVETLQTIRESCAECPVLSEEEVERLNAARRFGLGMRYADQWLLAAFDMALAGPDPVEVMEAWRGLDEATPLGHVAGTHFPARFSHVAGGYGAGYYGYMWSEVIALDMLSAFADNLMDPEVGRRFRREILARGGELPAAEIVEAFLGREVSPDAFFEEIQGARGQ